MRAHLLPGVWLLAVVSSLAVGAGACGLDSGPPPTSAPSPRTSSASAVASDPVRVTRVVDGDTIHVTFEGRDERVRFIGIDTPEIAHGGRPGECFGRRAAAQTRRRLEGRSVRLAFDVRLRDRFGRLLAYVYDDEGLVNLALVQEGFALALTLPPDTRLAGDFERAEDEARRAGRGVWSACPTPGA